jgi:hypothetical protein
MQVVTLPGGRAAGHEVIGSGRPALIFAGGPGFTASYMNGDAELLSDVLCSHLIDPHGSGSSTAPADPAGAAGSSRSSISIDLTGGSSSGSPPRTGWR